MAEWDAEFTVDPEAVRRAAGSPRSWRHLGTGWDSDAWLADESVVWRVPRRKVGIAALEREIAVMPKLAPHLPAAVPVPQAVEVDGLPLLARHELVPGGEMALAPDPGAALGTGLGQLLRALHDPARVSGVRAVLPSDPLGRGDPARRVPATHRRLDEIAARVDVAPLRPVVDAAAGPSPPPDVVCHGDLHLRHVLIGEGGELTGVIDWGDACLGVRAIDLMIATALPGDARAAFFDAYGSIDGATWRHARLLGVALGAALLAADPNGPVGAASRRWLERLVAESVDDPVR
jgi:aminoglycoside phosphotransferase (APT) family kinase protein